MFNNDLFKNKLLVQFLFLLLSISGCQRFVQGSQLTNNQLPTQTGSLQLTEILPEQTNEIQLPEENHDQIDVNSWWISDSIPESIKIELQFANQTLALEAKNQAVFWIDEEQKLGNLNPIYEKIFVVSTPLTSLLFEINWEDISDIWHSENKNLSYKIWVDAVDLPILEKIFGSIYSSNLLISSGLPEVCNTEICIRIQDFSNIGPKWRVIPVNGASPLYKDFELNSYPLVYQLFLSQNPNFQPEINQNITSIKPIINYNKSKLTSVLMTGTTALVRNIALNIEEYGLLYPGENISQILSSANFTHISNEVPFYSECPPGKPLRVEMRFCSDPAYIDLFEYSGVDIIELTGNHLLDWGPAAFQETLELYKKAGFSVYGGGMNESAAKQPLIIKHNGNSIVFIGCNVTGPDNNWATSNRPGASKCDMKFLTEQIRNFRQQGILPIVTFQDYEFEDFDPVKLVRDDFWAAAEAGAVIVSGSQAHFPQGIDEVNGAFIHYGLGNLFFDQMATWLRKATIDFHYFYDGRYVNTTIVPIINENYGQPRLMDQDEANRFLNTIYQHSYFYSKE